VTVMLLLAREQVRQHEIGVVCHSAGTAAHVADSFGARVWTVPAHRSVRLRDDLRHLVGLRRIVREFRPDVVHLHSSKAGVLGRLAARSEGVAVVYSPHNFAYRSYEGSARARRAFYLVERALAPLTDCLHVGSQEEYESAIGDGIAPPDRCWKILNAIDLEPLLALEPPPLRTPPVVGTFARLYRQKRLDLFLDALAELRRRGVPFRGLLIGDGPSSGELQAQARRLGLEDVVGFDEQRQDAAAALSRLDVFALTSSDEGGVLTVMEAMAAERAVVTTRVGVVPEVVDDGRSGMVVPPGDSRGFANALQRLIEDASLRQAFAAVGREEARRRFGPEAMAARMAAAYESAVARAGVAAAADPRQDSDGLRS
jgi:glycosyltransferase involved in cell wall biosynthesis